MTANPRHFAHCSAEELRLFKALNRPEKIQDFLNALPINFEEAGETCMSPRRVIREQKAHCLEGALFAAAALWFHGKPPLLMDLKTTADDECHTVTLFERGGSWGAISHTNHAVLRYREPVYRTLRELALSYFHEYFLDDGRKTLRSYSRAVNLSRINPAWLTAERDLWEIDALLDRTAHYPLVTPATARLLRRADPIEIEAGKIVVWKDRYVSGARP
ncbi:MAG: hypothetical protein Q8R13_06380 [bacterium]|nr:hypothetical protein [bacterium]MDZ4296417.1 hypothetical protein [Patescibacteria group bacterium]